MDIIDPTATLRSSLQQLVANKLAESQQARANRLSDLQYNALKREEDYQTGLRAAMSGARPDVTTTSVIPEKPQLSLAALGSQLQPPQFQPAQVQTSPLVQAYREGRVQSTTAKGQTPAQAGAEYALSQGRVEDAVRMYSVDDAVAQLQAKGDLQGYYKAKQELDQGAKFFEVLKPYKNNPAALEQVWPQIQRMFPDESEGIDPKAIGADANGMFAPLVVNGQTIPNRVVYHDDDGKTHIVDVTPKQTDNYKSRERIDGNSTVFEESIDGGRTWKKVSSGPRYKPATGAAGGRDTVQGGKPQGGKILPAGQLESIADMKRVKDVLAEASNDMASGKVSTGPVTGRLQSLGSKIGAADDDFVNVQQKLQTAQNIMLKLRSGAAVTESEYARFLKEYPTPNDPPAVFERKMANTLAYANTLMDDKMTIYEEGGYKVPRSVRSKPAAQQKANAPRVTKGGFKITVVK